MMQLDSSYYNYDGFGPSVPAGNYGVEPAQGDDNFPAASWGGEGFEKVTPATAGQLRFFLVLAAAWGICSGLSAMTQRWGVPMQFAQMAGLLLVIICLTLHGRGPRFLLASALDPAGGLMAIHGVVALISAAVAVMVTAHISIAQPLFALRYALVPVAFAAMIYARDAVPGGTAAVRAGLTFSGVVVCFCNLPSIPLNAIANPHFRLNTFLNATANAMVGAVTAISLFDYALTSWNRRPLRALLLFAIGVFAAFIVYLTRSRTGTLAYLAGLLVLILLTVRPWVGIAALLFAIPAWWFLLQRSLSDVGGSLAITYAMGEHGRDLATLTGRTIIWNDLIRDVWLPNFFLGAGPGIVNATAENGILQNLCDVGLLGTLPLLGVIFLAGLASIIHHRERSSRAAIAVFATGSVVSMATSQMFSFGNPASLMFLLALASLAGRLFQRRGDYDAQIPGAMASGVVAHFEPYQYNERSF